MTTAISAELFKLRTTRAPWATGLVLFALAAAALAFNAALLGDPGQPTAVPQTLADLVRAPGRLAGGAALLLGLFLTTAEYRHATILTTRLAQPRVPGLLLAKAAAGAIAGAILALAVELVMLLGAAILLATRDVTVEPLRHGTPAAIGAVVAVAALHAVIGVGIGELLRNPALAIGVVLGWAFIVEGVLPVVLGEPNLNRWLPTGAVDSALSLGLPLDHARLAPAAGSALLAGYALVLLAAGFGRMRRTDP